MPFEPGNQLWELRRRHGRRPLYETPEQLWEACVEYFQWVKDNPLMAAESVKFQGEGKVMGVPRMRAMTLGGLVVHLGITRQTWAEYRGKTGDPEGDGSDDFSAVTTQVEEIIYEQKLAGAAADLLNANIIARELGLADNHRHAGPDGGPVRVITAEMSDQEAFEAYAATLRSEQG